MVSVKAAEAKLLCAWVGEYKKDHKQFIRWFDDNSKLMVFGIIDFRRCKHKTGLCCIQASEKAFCLPELA
jgi:hypothetical protein